MRRPDAIRPFSGKLCVCLVSLVLASVAQATPILQNGDFSGTPAMDSAAPGWMIANGSPDIVSESGPFNNTSMPWTPSPNGGTWARGNGSGDYQGTQLSEAFEQLVTGFTLGEVYRLHFYQTNLGFFLSSQYEWRNHPGFWAVFVDGVAVGQSMALSGPATVGEEIQWLEDEVIFTATKSTHTLTFQAMTTASTVPNATFIAYLGIDGATLTVVPEPGTLFLMAIGLSLMAGLRRCWALTEADH